jgi:hypothetical protein
MHFSGAFSSCEGIHLACDQIAASPDEKLEGREGRLAVNLQEMIEEQVRLEALWVTSLASFLVPSPPTLTA